MTQEEFKNNFLEYAENNLNNETTLQAISQLLENISNELYENEYVYQSNKLTTSQLIIDEILKEMNQNDNKRIQQ